MGQKKLHRFAEIASFPNVFQHPQGMRGKWREHFKNDHPISLELACGKGEYAVGLGRLHPKQNFIGIDLKGNRIWVGAKQAIESKMENVAFLRTQIDHLTTYFEAGEVNEIWITFPDPQLRMSRAKKRLTHPKFLRLYKEVLKPGGRIHLKTDSPALYQFTKTVIRLYGLNVHADCDDIYSMGELPEELKIKTHYERLDIAESSRVHYVCFSIPVILPGLLKDEELKEQIKMNHEEVI
jgi:tRNA (guanine-N7-)-methyltransferase